MLAFVGEAPITSEVFMLLGSLGKTSKIVAMLCVCIAVVMSVICQLHAVSHTHATPPGGHHEDAPASTFDAFPCATAVIPSVDFLSVLLFLMLYVLLLSLKPLVPAFELDMPPRHLLP
jgi:hypothetical protein